jgi:hypothetical protein
MMASRGKRPFVLGSGSRPCKGNNEMFLMEGDTTLMRLKKEIDEAAERVDFGEGAFGEGPFGAG